jgi:hypothetical protein
MALRSPICTTEMLQNSPASQERLPGARERVVHLPQWENGSGIHPGWNTLVIPMLLERKRQQPILSLFYVTPRVLVTTTVILLSRCARGINIVGEFPSHEPRRATESGTEPCKLFGLRRLPHGLYDSLCRESPSGTSVSMQLGGRRCAALCFVCLATPRLELPQVKSSASAAAPITSVVNQPRR